jgi:hypothetical protein
MEVHGDPILAPPRANPHRMAKLFRDLFGGGGATDRDGDAC